MNIAIFFPGQGAQSAGMGKDFYENNEIFKATFDECEKACDMDLKDACFNGFGLEKTSVTQPALYAVNIATYKMLESMGIEGNVFAGLSLGEYSALSAAGVLGIASTTKLVAVRGTLMESAVPEGVASMTAVIGLSASEIENVISSIDNVWIANKNSNAQTVIGGTLEALDIADVKIKQAGAKIVKRLNVAGPFHTPLLKQAGDKLCDELEGYELSDTDKIVYANVSGSTYKKDSDIRGMLARQVSSTVNWVNIMDKVLESDDIDGDLDVIVECGPGNVLSKLTKKHAKLIGIDSVKVFSANSMKAIETIAMHVCG